MSAADGPLKRALTAPGPAIGAWIKLEGEDSAEIMARTGFDFLVVDLEHSSLSGESATRALRIASLGGRPVLVRTPDLDRVVYQRLLDAGAAAILAPQIESAAQAHAGASYAAYPPAGVRGFSTTTRAGDWGRVNRDEHLSRAGNEITFVPQLESEAALTDLDSILAGGGVDAVFIGSADLSVSMGLPQVHEKVQALIAAAVQACRQRGILVGTAVGGAAALTPDHQNFDFVVVGDDGSMLAGAARDTLAQARDAMSVSEAGTP